MSTIRTDKKTTLGLKLETGTSESGGTVYTTRNFQNFNPGLSDADFLPLGEGLGAMQKYPVNAVRRTDTATLATV